MPARHAAARDRLDALRAPTPDALRAPTPHPRALLVLDRARIAEPVPEPEPEHEPEPEYEHVGERTLGREPERDPLEVPRGWRGRWLPESVRGARVDPGHRGSLALAGVAVVAALLAVVGVWRERPVPQAAPALPAVEIAAATSDGPPTSSAAAAADPVPAGIVVSVAGAVARPGLVTLPAGARVDDALTAAGGALPGTDLLTLNRAQALTDGQQVLVGVAGAPVSGGGAGAGASAATAGPVNLNTAGESELEALPGVGPVMATAIITYREDNGGFRSVDELTEVSGIGDARFAQLKDLVGV